MQDIKFRKAFFNDSGEFTGFQHFIKEGEYDMHTGYTDENGLPIYEGDIILFTYWWFDGSERETELSGVIGYNKECMSYELIGIKNKEWLEYIGGVENDEATTAPFAFFNFEEADFRVIGNIHATPELLKY